MVKKKDQVEQYGEEQEQDVMSQQEAAGEVGTGRQSGDGLGSGHGTLALVDHREGSGGERSEPELPGRGATSAAAEAAKTGRPDPEVLPQAKRRTFSAKYKLEILRKTDALVDTGKVGALLRREGLHYSRLTSWRRQREEGTLAGLKPKRRGPKPDPDREARRRIAQLEKENRRLAERLEKAELIIEVQKRNLPDSGDRAAPVRERRGKLMEMAVELAREIGVAGACRAVSLPRATYYRNLPAGVLQEAAGSDENPAEEQVAAPS